MARKKSDESSSSQAFGVMDKQGAGAGSQKAAEQKSARLRELSADGMKLKSLPGAEHDRDLCTAALKQNGLALQYVPEADRDMYLCQKALRSNGLALEFVPQNLCSGSVCRLAVRNNGQALHFVPESVLDAEICRLAVKSDGLALRYVPATFLDKELCRLALRSNGLALEFVPEAMRTSEICYEAVRNNGLALRFVPGELCNPLMTTRALFSAVVDAQQRTTVICEAPPDWEELKAVKPRDEWKRFEKWIVKPSANFAFPEELTLPAETITECLMDLATRYVNACGEADFASRSASTRSGKSFFLELPREEGGVPWRVYAAGLGLLMQKEHDQRGVPLATGAIAAAISLMDWAMGWVEPA